MKYSQVTNRAQIISDIRDSMPAFSELDDDALELLVFRRRDNIRLTYQGCRMLSGLFENYSFAVSKYDLRPKHYIALSREFRLPYYFTDKILVVFSSEDATMITLCGDVHKFLDRIDIS